MWSDKYILQYFKKTMLKLSSPLRTDQNKDENKENILAGQGISKVKSEESGPVTEFCFPREQGTPVGADDSIIKSVDLNNCEGNRPVFVSSERNLSFSSEVDKSRSNSSSTENNHVIRNCENLVKTVIKDENHLDARLRKDTAKQEVSQPSFCANQKSEEVFNSKYDEYEDSTDVIEEVANPISENSCRFEVDLNSTYAVEENVDTESTFYSSQEFVEPKCEIEHLLNVTVVNSDEKALSNVEVGAEIDEETYPENQLISSLKEENSESISKKSVENQEFELDTSNEEKQISSNHSQLEKQIEEICADNENDENIEIVSENTNECIVEEHPNLSGSAVENSKLEESSQEEKNLISSVEGLVCVEVKDTDVKITSNTSKEETYSVLTDDSVQTLSVTSGGSEQVLENIEESENSNEIRNDSFKFTSILETTSDTSLTEIEKSTVILVSDSSGNSIDKLGDSPVTCENNQKTPSRPVSPSFIKKDSEEDYLNNDSPQISSKQNISLEYEELHDNLLESDVHVLNKSSSAFIVLSCPNTEQNVKSSTSEELEEITAGEKNSSLPSIEVCEKNSSLSSIEACEKNSTIPSIEANKLEDSQSESEYVETLENRSFNDEANQEVILNRTENIPNKFQLDLIEMSEINKKLQQENSDLKLEVNAFKQAKSSLELEMGKKDEIILKIQAEAINKEQQYLEDVKALKEQLKEKSSLYEKDSRKDLEEALKEAKAKENQALNELSARINDELNYRKIMEEYEKTIAARIADSQKLKEENETVTRHLANLELSFSDLHQKYERTKTIIDGFKTNEEKLRKKFVVFEETIHKQEEKYESLKAHARAQIEKSNKEIIQHKEKYDSEVTKLNAIIKRLEIKSAALETSLEQKTKECIALAALCDEVTGKKV
ncbi:hypothetical protein HHI36_022887 [Cryptolaemus montrouzieri]|uniref:Transforming acidic coiled-coil-containing protein C-terminal domain-containing protein n=1 Tax=Cryptolaemus montrouzieri TaxID=559131 RepID=A0ABD2PFA6_9CUCU